jgi:hypothetical protein
MTGRSVCRFDPVRFAAFEIYLLQREGAEKDYTPDQLQKAKAFFERMPAEEAAAFERSIIDVFPGVNWDLNIQDIRDRLTRYDDIDRNRLKAHLKLFLQDVIPVCEEAGVRFCPTGGLSFDNMNDYLALPTVSAIGGSWLATQQQIADKQWGVVTEQVKAALAKAAEL